MPGSAAVATHAFSAPNRWQVGDVVTRVIEKTTSAKTKVTPKYGDLLPDESAAPLPATHETVNATLVEKCTAVDADGRRTRYLVYVQDWIRQRGNTRDDSLRGSHVSVTRTASERKWSLVRQANEPSTEAKRWLDEEVGSRGVTEEEWEDIIVPDKRVAVGARWSVDIGRLANTLARSGARISEFKSAASGRLIGVDADTAEYGFKATLQLLDVPDARLAWTRGGAIELDSSFTVPVHGRLRIPSKVRSTTAIEGTAEDGPRNRQYDFRSSEERSTVLGGEFPPVEEPDDRSTPP